MMKDRKLLVRRPRPTSVSSHPRAKLSGWQQVGDGAHGLDPWLGSFSLINCGIPSTRWQRLGQSWWELSYNQYNRKKCLFHVPRMLLHGTPFQALWHTERPVMTSKKPFICLWKQDGKSRASQRLWVYWRKVLNDEKRTTPHMVA